MRRTPILLIALALFGLSGCSDAFSLALPETQNDPGYAGDWTAQVAGAPMVLRVAPFLEGASTSSGTLLWGDSVDWPMVCRLLPQGDGQLTLGCSFTIDEPAPVCSPGDDAPDMEITAAVPLISLTVEVGGELRQGTESACTGDVIVDWNPRNEYTFSRG